ncbi:hypothetical protein KIN20_036938 [Parelaphostrongylus tenuis]|uniref:Lipoprotein n=1 Tax=Parelaphostrongylus tenuis TaxID=148309 RepID=A0AAD5RDX5_PARTN|nr:hypothetical protein KIN20_036938 [Parelaphostrongylus tenuis]
MRFDFNCFMIFLLAVIATVFGCGVMPGGQESNRNFTVTGFSLPVNMVYSTKTDVAAQVPGIAASKEGAQAFVSRLVMQTVFDVLESQARSALLPDAIISAILRQLTLRITYQPLLCPNVALDPTNDKLAKKDDQRCIIVGNTVTGICTNTDSQGMEQKCTPTPDKVTISTVPGEHLSISGTLSTTNIIMANWSEAMWQSVVNKAVRALASGPFESHFFSASGNVGGNRK